MTRMLKRESLRRWDFSKAFITSLMIHAILIFGLGFTLFQIQERFDPQRVVNVKFANANFDSLGNLSSLNNTQETINDEERSAAKNVSNQSFQAMSIRRLEANSLQNDSESRYLNSWQRKVETIGFYETNRISFEQDSMTRIKAIINAEGELVDAQILQSSGSDEIDNLAMNILKEASPFLPFDDQMLSMYEFIEIVRDWNFYK
jgi:TonB family protein